MHGEDFEFEEVEVAVAEGSSLEEFEFVVGGFEWFGGDGVVVPVQQSAAMTGDGFGELLEDSDTAGLGVLAPGGEEAFGGGLGGLAPELSQVFLEIYLAWPRLSRLTARRRHARRAKIHRNARAYGVRLNDQMSHS